MDVVADFFMGLLTNDKTSSSSQHAIISFIVFVVCLAIIVAIIVSLYRVGKIIREYSRKEYDREQTQSDYNQKIDDTREDIQKLSDVVLKISTSVEVANQQTQKEIKTLYEKIEKSATKDPKGCNFGRNVRNEVEALRNELVAPLEQRVNLLTSSKRNEIKEFITKEYHYWMPRGEIDIYSWEVIRARYLEYEQYNGNTFVGGMVTELSQLKRICQVQNCQTDAMIQDRDDVRVNERPHEEKGREEQ